MILPSKHLSEDRALLRIGAEILLLLHEPKTISRLWNDLRVQRRTSQKQSQITFNWFVLALDLLYVLGAISYEHGRLMKEKQ